MKKQFLLSALLLTSLSATFVSCKKDKDPEKSRKDLITGTWTVSGLGKDANNNGSLEESEYDPTFKQLAAFGVSPKQTFMADGTGNITATIPLLGDTTVRFTWSLVDNDETIRIKSENDPASGDATITKLDNISFEYLGKDNTSRNVVKLTR
jgi:hypothetical protein